MTASERIISEALALPAADRLDVIEQLWESLAADPQSLELTDAQRRELDRRIEEMDANSMPAFSGKLESSLEQKIQTRNTKF